jgi:hypothetical protein
MNTNVLICSYPIRVSSGFHPFSSDFKSVLWRSELLLTHFIEGIIIWSQTGGHDNGYTSTLNYLENEGLLGKIVLLKGYKDLAMDVRSLNLPQLKIEGVFMRDKLPTSTYASPAKAAQRLQFEDPHKYRPSRQHSPKSPSRKAAATQVCCILLRNLSTQVRHTTAWE